MSEQLIGIISDTHGKLRQSAVDALAGVSLIIHAGDVCGADVLEGLRGIARVVAVRGNMDKGDWGYTLPPSETVDVDGRLIHVLHDLTQLDIDPAAAGCAAVVFGHSHEPTILKQRDVLYLNPGSAGPRRENLPVTLMLLRVGEANLLPEVINLED